ncbi:OB-fold domain-containing protein [Streptosporangiaceae bacterium NEAU-GS5]|nr:OB-fold domain-containing protein [Streptosporangiaceae bacterium NEAU-GS5]
MIGRFLTELRDARLVGVRTAAGRTLVPPLEYDPDSGEPVTNEWVDVGPAGTVEAVTWVDEPREQHPLDRPFAWALIKLDGADTALVHAVEGDPKTLKKGTRVRPRWRTERTGSITDIECFVPEVTSIVSRIRTEYVVRPGQAVDRFLQKIADGVFLGGYCATCDKVYVPYRLACPQCGNRIAEEREVADTGTVTTYAINNLPDPRAPEVPFVSAYVMLDGADVPFIALVVPVNAIRQGLRVKAVWADELSPSMSSVKWFSPLEEES